MSSTLVWFFGDEQINGYLVFSGDNVLRGYVWTLVTGLFLHGDIFHFFGLIPVLFLPLTLLFL